VMVIRESAHVASPPSIDSIVTFTMVNRTFMTVHISFAKW
jgi:hypothetical protein